MDIGISLQKSLSLLPKYNKKKKWETQIEKGQFTSFDQVGKYPVPLPRPQYNSGELHFACGAHSSENGIIFDLTVQSEA